jgi:hypothetical protein
MSTRPDDLFSYLLSDKQQQNSKISTKVCFSCSLENTDSKCLQCECNESSVAVDSNTLLTVCLFFSFFFFFPWGLRKPRLAHCSHSRLIVLNPALVPRSSPEVLHVRRRERPLLTKGGIRSEKWPVKFSLTLRLPRHCRVL